MIIGIDENGKIINILSSSSGGVEGYASLDGDNVFTGMNTFEDAILADEIDDATGINVVSVADDGTRKLGSVLKGLKLASNSDIEVRKGNEETIGYVLDTLNIKNISGYDATKTQTLKHVNGVLTWIEQ